MKQYLRHTLVIVLTAGFAAAASAQVDLSGRWRKENFQDFTDSTTGPFPSDFTGIPLNEQGRKAAQSHSASSLSQLQRQCQPWLVHYVNEGLFGFRMWATTNDQLSGKVTAWHMSGWHDRMPTTIVVDGSPPPSPLALHTHGGYSTGVWKGNTLITTTTHIKDGYLKRNGVPSSNQETFRMFITRHGNRLTVTSIVRDPVYLDGPYPITQVYTLDPGADAAEAPMHCSPATEASGLASGYESAAWLPGKNPTLTYMQEHYNIPFSAAMGGIETMFPEYQKELQGKYKIPAQYCTQYCCGTSTGGGGLSPFTFDKRVLQCRAQL